MKRCGRHDDDSPARPSGRDGLGTRPALPAWARRIGWLVALWLAGVLTVTALASLLKWIMGAVGLSAF